MTLDILKERGVPLDQQTFTWRDLVRAPLSKLDDDALTRVRVILMNGIEQESNRFLHALARRNRELRVDAARVRRIDHHQQTLVNWLNPADQSPLETTIGFEQTAIEITASVALAEPDPYLAQLYRFGLLEDFDHLYRFTALMDRVEGRDSNTILQGYTDILPGRPTAVEHRAPVDDVRRSYRTGSAEVVSKLNALTIVSAENMVRDYYMVVGPLFADPVARMLYAEIVSVEEQHVTHYESILDPDETWLEQWVMHEANEVYNYWSCAQSEGDDRIRKVWERFCDYELGQLHYVLDLFERHEGRDREELLPRSLPEPIQYKSHREFVRDTLREVPYRAVGTEIGELEESAETLAYREQLDSEGSPSEEISKGYRWQPGTELAPPMNGGGRGR